MQEVELRKGPWLEEEDELLSSAVAVLGDRRWDALAKSSGLRRSGKSCRLRWMNYLRPNLKHGNISADEERVIVQLHEKWGNKWSRIARRLPGRTDNEIKNYWRCYMKKKALVLDKEECGTAISPCSTSGDIVGPTSTDDALEMLSLTCDSPYETRLTEWMCNYCNFLPSDDMHKKDPKDEPWNYDLCFSECISDDFSNNSSWNYSLWDGE